MTLFAGFPDLTAIIPIIFFIIWVISQVVGATKQQPQARPIKRNRVAPGKGPPAGVANDEIQQFLLEADNQRPRPKVGGMQVAEPIVLERDNPLSIAKPAQIPDGQQPMGQLDTSEFTQRTAQLGSGVRSEESQMSARRNKLDAARHKKFDHDLGKLSKSSTTDRSQHPERFKKVPKSAAAGLVAMLADGKSLRDAVIFSEIINRPTDRW